MKRLATTAAAILIAAPAFAAVDFETADTNDDGFLTLSESLAAYPEMDPADFDDLDTTDDRLLDPSEASAGRATAVFGGLEQADPATSAVAFDMTEYDVDGDGVVTYEEVDNRIPGVPEVYFQDFDVDNSGGLDSNELNSSAFQNLLNKYGA